MSFEEEFPSVAKMFKDENDLSARTNIPLIALKMCCLDKQRVKETLDAVSVEMGVEAVCKRIKERLRL